MAEINSSRVNVMVADMDKSVEFYTKKLGLTLLNQYGPNYAEVQAPDLLIGLHPKSDKTTMGDNISIGFGTKVFDKQVKELKSLGIDVELEVDGWIRLAYFKDLDGNVLFFAENK